MINDVISSNAIYIQMLNYTHPTTLMAQTRKKSSAANTTKSANKTRKHTQDIIPPMSTSEPVTTIPSTSASEPVTQHPALGDVTTAVNNTDLSVLNDLKGM